MGSPVLPIDVDNVTFREELKSGLFAPLSTLKILSLRFWEPIGIHEGWKFPKGIEELSLELCDLIELDLREYTNLKLLDLNANKKLIRMPLLSSPRPPLRTLRLVSNEHMKLTVEDIVDLCQLRWLDLENFNEYEGQGNTVLAIYCECKRMENYMIALNISGQYSDILCGFYRGFKEQQCIKNYPNYRIDHLIDWHKKNCSTARPMTTTMEPEIEPWRPEPHPEPDPEPQPVSKPDKPPPNTTKIPPIVCPSCPGCFLCVIGWFFFLVTLFSSGAAIAIYIVITKRLFFFPTVSRKK
ncbi:uncharacterized protein LOC135843848 isoform X2 [Planococcus citri]|uniref:uncharacterized protein LOC135843848 isoform X2 n=1 Tax=Planococcus citri TaxID=170843 RepID=UPI0031F8E093